MRAATRMALAALTIVLAHAAHAQDALKLAVGQRGNWENAMPELGQKAGIFKKHGLELEILYTQGGGETQQAVISGSVDIGIGVGTGGAMGAFAKGAPIRAFANSMTGAHDLYWYVPANSPIKSMKDAGGRSIAYSTRGSSTNMIVLGFAKHFGIDAKPVAAGNPASTFTQTMSGQIDVGWASPPFGVEAIEQGRIRVVARGSDVPSFRDQTVRVQIVNAAALEAKKDALARFVQAWRETIDVDVCRSGGHQGLCGMGQRARSARQARSRRVLPEGEPRSGPHRRHRAGRHGCDRAEVPVGAADEGAARPLLPAAARDEVAPRAASITGRPRRAA